MHPDQIHHRLTDTLTRACQQALGEFSGEIILEKPRHSTHGHIACPIALILAKQTGAPPRALADRILAAWRPPDFIEKTEIAGPGFINITLSRRARLAVIQTALRQSVDYGRHPPGRGPLLIEFISANPTGPLHIGHGRACAYGDSLANLLTFIGHDITREYYINNAGRQMNILAASVWLRPHLKAGEEMPKGGYRGDYLIPVATRLTPHLATAAAPSPDLPPALRAIPDPDQAADALIAAWRQAMPAPETYQQALWHTMMDDIIKKDMQSLSVDTTAINFFPETDLHRKNGITAALDRLRDHLYEKDGALWFRSTAHGDEKDRVIRRSNGEWTYFAADIAYHHDKLTRPGAPRLLNILGADHHGYTPRVAAAIIALGHPRETLETQYIQFVSLYSGKKRLKMSTREGEFIPIQTLIQEVGADAARYFLINRKNDQHLDFDLEIAKKQDEDNPLYYIQYAHVRIAGLLRKWGGDPATLSAVPLGPLQDDPAADPLIETLFDYPRLLQLAAKERAPHRLAHYLQECAGRINTYYEKRRILPPEGGVNDETLARLALLLAAKTLLHTGARLLGVILPEKL